MGHVEQRQYAISALAHYLMTEGRLGEVPPWYGQFMAARALSCPPWELDEAFEHASQGTRAEWVDRAGMATEAERRAQGWSRRSIGDR